MSYDWALYFCLFLALWSAVIAGVFSAFSEFVMDALLLAAPTAGIDVMQRINRRVLRTQFVGGILSIAMFSPLFAIYGFFTFDGAAKVTLILASLVYLPTVFLMTVFGNVPMNERLDRLKHTDPDAEAYWRHYGRVWTMRNLVRYLGSVVTAGLYIIAAITLITSGQV